jgi:hypothetical protein
LHLLPTTSSSLGIPKILILVLANAASNRTALSSSQSANCLSGDSANASSPMICSLDSASKTTDFLEEVWTVVADDFEPDSGLVRRALTVTFAKIRPDLVSC